MNADTLNAVRTSHGKETHLAYGKEDTLCGVGWSAKCTHPNPMAMATCKRCLAQHKTEAKEAMTVTKQATGTIQVDLALLAAADELADAKARRDQLVCEAFHEGGLSHRQIADLAGISHTQVQRIIGRNGRQV